MAIILLHLLRLFGSQYLHLPWIYDHQCCFLGNNFRVFFLPIIILLLFNWKIILLSISCWNNLNPLIFIRFNSFTVLKVSEQSSSRDLINYLHLNTTFQTQDYNMCEQLYTKKINFWLMRIKRTILCVFVWFETNNNNKKKTSYL